MTQFCDRFASRAFVETYNLTISSFFVMRLPKLRTAPGWNLGIVLGSLLALLALEPMAFAAGFSGGEGGNKVANQSHGRLEVSSFFMEAPDEMIRLGERPDERPVWRLAGRDPSAALEALAAAGIGTEALAALKSPGSVSIDAGGVTFLPSLDFLVALAPAVRDSVYRLLARNGLNPRHERPQVIPGDPEEWLRGCALSPRQKGLFRALLWRREGALAFSDVSALILAAGSAGEIQEALRIMTRVRTVRVTVRPPGGGDTARFSAYWSAGGLNRSAMPLVESSLETSPQSGIDVLLLLPPLARARLYTFPSVQDATAGRLPDCNWTSLNFFAERPGAYYLDGKASYLTLTQDYEEVSRADRLGDVIAFIGKDGGVHHTCVHVAEDIVFTKNGQMIFSPWLLQRLDDVAAIYGGQGRTVRFYRLKPGRG